MKSIGRKAFSAGLFFLMVWVPAGFSEDSEQPEVFKLEEFRLDGVMFEASNPTASQAAVNGELVSAGDKLGEYQVESVQRDGVILKDASGVMHTLALDNVPEASSSAPVPGKALPAPAVKAGPAGAKDFFGIPLSFDPGKIMEMAANARVMGDMRSLYTQVAMTYADEGQISSLAQMIAKGQVNPAFADVKNGYRYQVSSGKQGPAIHADPADAKDAGKRHFMIDSWGNLRSERGKPASEKSPLFEV